MSQDNDDIEIIDGFSSPSKKKNEGGQQKDKNEKDKEKEKDKEEKGKGMLNNPLSTTSSLSHPNLLFSNSPPPLEPARDKEADYEKEKEKEKSSSEAKELEMDKEEEEKKEGDKPSIQSNEKKEDQTANMSSRKRKLDEKQNIGENEEKLGNNMEVENPLEKPSSARKDLPKEKEVGDKTPVYVDEDGDNDKGISPLESSEESDSSEDEVAEENRIRQLCEEDEKNFYSNNLSLIVTPPWVHHNHLSIYSIDISQKYNEVITSGRDGLIKIWNLKAIQLYKEELFAMENLRKKKRYSNLFSEEKKENQINCNNINNINNNIINNISSSSSNNANPNNSDKRNALLCVLSSHHRPVNCVRYSFSNELIASGSDGGEEQPIIIWKRKNKPKSANANNNNINNPNEDSELANLGIPKNFTNSVEFDIKYKLLGHSNDIQDLSFSGNDEFLASCSIDNTIAIWNLRNGEISRVLRGHEGWVKGKKKAQSYLLLDRIFSIFLIAFIVFTFLFR